MQHYLLFYDLSPDYMERRPPLREEHLALARAAIERGELVLGGALADPPDEAVLLIAAEDEAHARRIVQAFTAADPYVQRGLVTGWRLRRWMTVVGPLAAAPAPPA